MGNYIKAKFTGKNAGGPSPAFSVEMQVHKDSILAIRNTGAGYCDIVIDIRLEESINKKFFQRGSNDLIQSITIDSNDAKKLSE